MLSGSWELQEIWFSPTTSVITTTLDEVVLPDCDTSPPINEKVCYNIAGMVPDRGRNWTYIYYHGDGMVWKHEQPRLRCHCVCLCQWLLEKRHSIQRLFYRIIIMICEKHINWREIANKNP